MDDKYKGTQNTSSKREYFNSLLEANTEEECVFACKSRTTFPVCKKEGEKKKDWRDLRLTATLKTGSCCQVQNKSI